VISKADLPETVNWRSKASFSLSGRFSNSAFTGAFLSGCQLLDGSPEVRVYSLEQKRGFSMAYDLAFT
jgi:hypothetical protein